MRRICLTCRLTTEETSAFVRAPVANLLLWSEMLSRESTLINANEDLINQWRAELHDAVFCAYALGLV